jgi:hypothetical protein
MIEDKAQESAMMNEKSKGLWASIPGDSKIEIFKDHYFYDISNLQDVFFANKKANAIEKGPFRIQEFDEFLNRTYSDDNDTVTYKLYRYFKMPNDTDQQAKQDENITTINLPSLAVWFQAKNAAKSQIALKVLYTIYNSLYNDFFYSAIQLAFKTIQSNSTNYLSIFKDDYFSEDFKEKMTYDQDFGVYGNNNALFIRAVLTHPSEDSKFIMNYWGLTEVEIRFLKLKFLEAKEIGLKNQTQIDLAAKQWLDMSITKGDPISKLNVTAPGYLEFGAYLKYVLNRTEKSSLTLEKAKKLFFQFNDFGNSHIIDDSASLINKVNIETIFEKNETEAINFIDEKMQIENLTESKAIYGYINYALNELGLRVSSTGTPGIAAIADFLSQATYQIFNNIGWDSYFGLLQHNIYLYFNTKQSCIDAFNYLNFTIKFNSTLLCSSDKLNTTKYENIKIWINGVLYGDVTFKNYIFSILNNITEYDYLEFINPL